MRQVWEQLGFLHWPVDVAALARACCRPGWTSTSSTASPTSASCRSRSRRRGRRRSARASRPRSTRSTCARTSTAAAAIRASGSSAWTRPACSRWRRARRLPAAVLRRRHRDGGDDRSRDGPPGRQVPLRPPPVARGVPRALPADRPRGRAPRRDRSSSSWPSAISCIRASGGALRTARVHHAPYPLQPGAAGDVAQTLTYVAGLPLAASARGRRRWSTTPEASTSRSSGRALTTSARSDRSRAKQFRGSNSVVECHLAKVDVEGSSPFSRSRKSKA